MDVTSEPGTIGAVESALDRVKIKAVEMESAANRAVVAQKKAEKGDEKYQFAQSTGAPRIQGSLAGDVRMAARGQFNAEEQYNFNKKVRTSLEGVVKENEAKLGSFRSNRQTIGAIAEVASGNIGPHQLKDIAEGAERLGLTKAAGVLFGATTYAVFAKLAHELVANAFEKGSERGREMQSINEKVNDIYGSSAQKLREQTEEYRDQKTREFFGKGAARTVSDLLGLNREQSEHSEAGLRLMNEQFEEQTRNNIQLQQRLREGISKGVGDNFRLGEWRSDVIERRLSHSQDVLKSAMAQADKVGALMGTFQNPIELRNYIENQIAAGNLTVIQQLEVAMKQIEEIKDRDDEQTKLAAEQGQAKRGDVKNAIRWREREERLKLIGDDQINRYQQWNSF